MSQQNIPIAIAVIVVVALGAWYFLSQGDSAPVENSEPVATVNGEEITRSELDALRTQVATQQNTDPGTIDEKQVLDTLIAQALIRQAAAQTDVTVSDEQVAAEVSSLTAQVGGEEAFTQAMAAQGITEDELRSQIRDQLITQAYLEQELELSQITATDEEVTTAYEEIATGGEEVPPLEEVRGQVEELVIQQKQQTEVDALIAQLRAEAEVEVLI